MKAIHWITSAAALAFVQLTPALAATTDPEVLIYRFPGVRDDGGGDNAGVATVFHCTNFSGVTEHIRWVTRDRDGTLKGSNLLGVINHLVTATVSTHLVAAYDNETVQATGVVAQGTTAIAATSSNIICTAESIDASTAAPVGVARRGIRFNPAPGSQE